MPSTPTFTMAIYSPKLTSKLKGIHHSSISHRVQIFVDKACVIAMLQSEHSLRSYRNARNLFPLFLDVMFTPAIVPAARSSCFQNRLLFMGPLSWDVFPCRPSDHGHRIASRRHASLNKPSRNREHFSPGTTAKDTRLKLEDVYSPGSSGGPRRFPRHP